jgi:hypothetical protein
VVLAVLANADDELAVSHGRHVLSAVAIAHYRDVHGATGATNGPVGGTGVRRGCSGGSSL